MATTNRNSNRKINKTAKNLENIKSMLDSRITKYNNDIEIDRKIAKTENAYKSNYTMASDLIKALVTLISKHGDIPVFVATSEDDDTICMNNLVSIGVGKVNVSTDENSNDEPLKLLMCRHDRGHYIAISFNDIGGNINSKNVNFSKSSFVKTDNKEDTTASSEENTVTKKTTKRTTTTKNTNSKKDKTDAN